MKRTYTRDTIILTALNKPKEMTDFPTLSYAPTSEFSNYPSLYPKPKKGTLLNTAQVTWLFLVYPASHSLFPSRWNWNPWNRLKLNLDQ